MQNQKIIRKLFGLDQDTFMEMIIQKNTFVKDHEIPGVGYVTSYMNSKITHLHGPAIVKQENLVVKAGIFQNNLLHGMCWLYKEGILQGLE